MSDSLFDVPGERAPSDAQLVGAAVPLAVRSGERMQRAGQRGVPTVLLPGENSGERSGQRAGPTAGRQEGHSGEHSLPGGLQEDRPEQGELLPYCSSEQLR